MSLNCRRGGITGRKGNTTIAETFCINPHEFSHDEEETPDVQ
jgi:hypothetical protein